MRLAPFLSFTPQKTTARHLSAGFSKRMNCRNIDFSNFSNRCFRHSYPKANLHIQTHGIPTHHALVAGSKLWAALMNMGMTPHNL